MKTATRPLKTATRPRTASAVEVEGLRCRYGDSVVVDDLNLQIPAGEFCSLLGPSGSGKTTTLMAIAGFVAPVAGRIKLDTKDITHSPPNRRGLGIVYQNYALFPHMSVAQNVSFPLEMRKVPRQERNRRIESALEMVGLAGLGSRRPHQLSGGQQQRVALARAMVFEPEVLLMDEPLGALDKKLRVQLQTELKSLQQRIGVTVIYVTHDQDEALTMSDTVVVMDEGVIEQKGTPQALYEHPESLFTAGFVGESNLFDCEIVEGEDGGMGVARLDGGSVIRGVMRRGARAGARAKVQVRPSHMTMTPLEAQATAGRPLENGVIGRVMGSQYLGDAYRYRVALEDSAPGQTQYFHVTQGGAPLPPDARVEVTWSPDRTHLFGDS